LSLPTTRARWEQQRRSNHNPPATPNLFHKYLVPDLSSSESFYSSECGDCQCNRYCSSDSGSNLRKGHKYHAFMSLHHLHQPLGNPPNTVVSPALVERRGGGTLQGLYENISLLACIPQRSAAWLTVLSGTLQICKFSKSHVGEGAV
jgi:hypothetical protein